MSILKTIFQLNKLQKLLIKREIIEVETKNIKQELLKSELVNLLGSIVKESNQCMQNNEATSDTPLSASERDIVFAEAEGLEEKIATETFNHLNESKLHEDSDITIETSDTLKDNETGQSESIVNNSENPVELSDEVRQKLLVTIQSFDKENNIVFLQAEDRMFDFPYSPEDHVGASEGDTRELIIYEDDTYLFNSVSLQEGNAA